MTLDPRITFTRASLGTYYGSDGLLKYAAHNLTFPSEDFSSATWVKGSGATVTADATTAPNATTTADRINHVTAGTVNGGSVSNANFGIPPAIFSVYAMAGTKTFLVMANSTSATGTQNCYFNLSAGTVGTLGSAFSAQGIQSVGSGWYRCWAKATTATSITLRVGETNGTITCTSPGDLYLWGAQVEQFTTETAPKLYMSTTTAIVGGPRFDYDPVTHAPLGLLIEEARTNNINYSQDFDNAAWNKSSLTVTANQTTAPDGTVTADLLTTTASPNTSLYQVLGALSAGQVYTVSVYAKKGTSDWFFINGRIISPDEAPRAWFNLNTGVVGTIEAGLSGATIRSVGNGWYRCSITRLGTAGAERAQFGVSDADNSDVVTVGRTVYLWGAQIEIFANMSTYIPVPAASTVTRAADVAVMTGTNFSSWYNQPAGTFVAEFDLIAASGTRGIASADNAATTERIWLYGNGTDPKVAVTDGGTAQADIDVGTIAAGTVYKLGISYALNDIAGCLNGGTVGTDTTATMPTPTQLRIGADATPNYLNGHLRRIRFYNVAKSDAELQTLTT